MANLNWTKTETGYVADGYALIRTPGRRWIVTHNGEQIGAQVASLDAAKTRAQNFEPVTEVVVPVPVVTNAVAVEVAMSPVTAAESRPTPRESLTEQYTRLLVYRDLGVRRAFDRSAA